MPLYRGVISKQLILTPTIQWSNVYVIDESSLADAMAVLVTIEAAEVEVHTDQVRFFKRKVTGISFGGGSIVEASGLEGVITGDPAITLPLWNTARVDFTDATGRPELKYLRLPLQTDMITGTEVSSVVRNRLSTDYLIPLLAIPQYVGPSGEAHTSGLVHIPIQMRQQHWARRFRPGFHRGWIAD